MTTVELEARKAMLAREILTSDDSDFLESMSRAALRIKRRIGKRATAEHAETLDGEESVARKIEEALQELKAIKAGKAQGIPARKLLKELEAEE